MSPPRQHIPSTDVRLVRHQFGNEGAAYVRSYLQANEGFGKHLGALLATRDIEAGTTWALVPKDSALDSRVSFIEGGLFPPSGPVVTVEVGYMVPSFDASAHPQIREAVAALSARQDAGRRLMFVEEAYEERRDMGPGRSDAMRLSGGAISSSAETRSIATRWVSFHRRRWSACSAGPSGGPGWG